MSSEVYRYTFLKNVQLEDVESSILLAIVASESVYGESRSRLDIEHYLDTDQRVCVVDASTEVGCHFNRLLVGFLRREFGDDGFRVERVDRLVSSASAQTHRDENER